MGKGENASFQHFLLFSQCFQKATFSELLEVGIVWYRIKLLPNDKILALSKLKAFADDKFNVAQIVILLLDRIEDIAGKGENAGIQYFHLFPQCF